MSGICRFVVEGVTYKNRQEGYYQRGYRELAKLCVHIKRIYLDPVLADV